jgi:hypothetical protein
MFRLQHAFDVGRAATPLVNKHAFDVSRAETPVHFKTLMMIRTKAVCIPLALLLVAILAQGATPLHLHFFFSCYVLGESDGGLQREAVLGRPRRR